MQVTTASEEARKGDDQLFGEAGDHTIWGGKDDDLLDGGLGQDICIGGKSAVNDKNLKSRYFKRKSCKHIHLFGE